MNIVASILSNTHAKYGLLLAGDTSAREFSVRHKQKEGHAGTWLFGDSGTATLIEKSEGDQLKFLSNTDGSGYKAIISPYGGWRNPDSPDGRVQYSVMDDIAVFNFATEEATNQLNDYMGMTGTSPEDYDCLVLHQANLMIMKRVAKKSGFPEEKMLVSMDRFGNTSSASIPLTLVDKYGESDGTEKVHALCCGFGVGLSWATVALELGTADILPLVHTDEYYTDGYNLDDLNEQA
jgi:3-oxoacyl-[acyl-carrier-protein] synthase-3